MRSRHRGRRRAALRAVAFVATLGTTPPAAAQSATEPTAEPIESPPTVDTTALLPADPSRLEVLVVPLQADRIPRALARSLEAILVAELDRRSGLRVVTFDADIGALLAVERVKDLLDCEDVICAADIGGTIGADRILTGAVGRIAGEYILTLRWLDARYAEPLAMIAEQMTGEEALVVATRRGVARLLDISSEQDTVARQHKLNPTFWTTELSIGFATRAEPEPYTLGFSATVRESWGGRWSRLGWFFYAVGGLQFSYLYGKKAGEVGRLRYERAQLVPFLELRTAIPIANQNRTRLYVGGGGGATYERHRVHQGKGLTIDGESWSPELRLVGGAWHRFSYRHSMFGNYRFRAQFFGAGADPVSELIAPGSSDAIVYTHEIEIGWAIHF